MCFQCSEFCFRPKFLYSLQDSSIASWKFARFVSIPGNFHERNSGAKAACSTALNREIRFSFEPKVGYVYTTQPFSPHIFRVSTVIHEKQEYFLPFLESSNKKVPMNYLCKFFLVSGILTHLQSLFCTFVKLSAFILKYHLKEDCALHGWTLNVYLSCNFSTYIWLGEVCKL